MLFERIHDRYFRSESLNIVYTIFPTICLQLSDGIPVPSISSFARISQLFIVEFKRTWHWMQQGWIWDLREDPARPSAHLRCCASFLLRLMLSQTKDLCR
jgi:hypothetical protein